MRLALAPLSACRVVEAQLALAQQRGNPRAHNPCVRHRTYEQPPESFARPRQNHLLAALPAAELEPLLQHMTLTGLALGAVLYEPGSKMDDVYFPISGVVSLI
jgi:hypothetical protein